MEGEEQDTMDSKQMTDGVELRLVFDDHEEVMALIADIAREALDAIENEKHPYALVKTIRMLAEGYI